MTIAEKLQKIYDNTPVVYEKGNLDTLGKVYNRNFTNDDIKFPEDITNIGNYAYAGCENLTAITIPEQIQAIGEKAFLDCINLNSITVPWNKNNTPAGAPWGATNATINYKLNTVNLNATIKLKDFKSEGVGQQYYYLYDEISSSDFQIIIDEVTYYDRSIFYYYIFLPDSWSKDYFYITNTYSWNPMPPLKLNVETFYYGGAQRKGYKPSNNYAEIHGSHTKSWDEIINAFSYPVDQILQYGDFFNTPDESRPIDITSNYRIGSGFELQYTEYQHTGTYEISLSNIPSVTGAAKLIDNDTGTQLDISMNGEETLTEQFTVSYNTPDSWSSDADLFYYMQQKNFASTITNPALKFVYNKFSTTTLDNIGPYTNIWSTLDQFTIEY